MANDVKQIAFRVSVVVERVEMDGPVEAENPRPQLMEERVIAYCRNHQQLETVYATLPKKIMF